MESSIKWNEKNNGGRMKTIERGKIEKLYKDICDKVDYYGDLGEKRRGDMYQSFWIGRCVSMKEISKEVYNLLQSQTEDDNPYFLTGEELKRTEDSAKSK